MTSSIFIDGGAGTTGLEIADRLAANPAYTLVTLDADHRRDAAARADALNSADIVILCLPDAAAAEAVALIRNGRTRVIDASSAHRTAPGWTYGFAELALGQRAAIAGAARVSNPGCYPTGFLALIAPLVARGLLPADWPYSVHAVSGYSGGGKPLIARFEAAGGGIGWRGYGLAGGHRHLAEMRVHGGLVHDPLFAPAVIPAYRGMAVEVPLPLPQMPGAAPAATLAAALADHYRGSALVAVAADVPDELLLPADALPDDRLRLYIAADAAGRARAIACLDNLGKGASGAAVQNLNLMAGLAETAGLRV